MVNLDGVVSEGALRAIEERELLEYMRRTRMDYTADYESSIKATYAHFYGREPTSVVLHFVGCEGAPWEDSAIHIYRLLD